jgi:hypothetical protein
VERKWAGVPRKRTMASGAVDCVCVNPDEPYINDDVFSVYPGCKPWQSRCYIDSSPAGSGFRVTDKESAADPVPAPPPSKLYRT